MSEFQLRLVAVLAFALTLMAAALPRFATVNLYGVMLAVVLFDPVQRHLRGKTQVAWLDLRSGPPFLLPLLLFTAWALISLMWSANPQGGFVKVVLLAGLIAMCLGTGEGIRTAHVRLLKAIGAGILAGMIVSGGYIVLETLSTRGISKIIYSYFTVLQPDHPKHIKTFKNGAMFISDANINRSTAIYCLLFWPALLIAYGLEDRRWRWGAFAGLAAIGLLLMLRSTHQSTQIALFAGLAVAGGALISRTVTRRVLAAGWVATLALVVPLSLFAFQKGWHVDPDLFHSARARLIIWNFTAERVLERPILGVGTDATRTLDAAREPEKVRPKDFATAPETRAHPHNAYLHIWYELGLVGAVLFGWIGLALLFSTIRFDPRLQPFALAHMAATAAIIASSYGFWQTWMQAGIAFSFLALLVAIRISPWPKL